VIFGPVDETDDGQQQLGEHATRSYDWALAKGNGAFERSQAFEGLILSGMGWEDFYIDKSRDPRGLPKMCCLPGEEMIWPQTSNQNLDGTRWRARESYIDVDEACTRWPKQAAMIRNNAPGTGGQDFPKSEDTIKYTVPYIETKPLDTQRTTDGQEGKVPILEWQYWEDLPGVFFYDPLEGEALWLEEKKFNLYKKRLEAITEFRITDFTPETRRTFKKVFILNDRYKLGDTLEMVDNLFTFLCMTGSYDQEEKIFYGYFRVVVDPQKYANKFFNQVLELMGVQAKGGILFEEGALKPGQIKKLEAEYAKAGSVNQVPKGTIAGKRIMFKPLPEMPVSTLGILEFCIKAMDNVTGISPDAAFGQGNGNVPGVTLRQRGKSSLLLLAREFDSLSRFRIEEAYVLFGLLKTLADDRLIRVGGAFDGQVIKLMREPFAVEYELSLDDTERDPNIRKEFQQNMVAIMPMLVKTEWFAPEFIDYLIIPYKAKQILKRAIKGMAQAKADAARRGEIGGGRGSRLTPEERQAKIGKTMADIQVQQAKVENIKGRTQRDAVRTILEALAKQQEIKLQREQHGADMTDKAMEFFGRATGRDSLTSKAGAARPRKRQQPTETEA
jgi:hypothetical protein